MSGTVCLGQRRCRVLAVALHSSATLQGSGINEEFLRHLKRGSSSLPTVTEAPPAIPTKVEVQTFEPETWPAAVLLQ